MVLSEWLISLTGIAVVVTVADVLMPDGRMREICKSVLSVVCIAVIIVPLINLKGNSLKIEEIADNGENNSAYSENLISYYENITKTLCENHFKKLDTPIECDVSGELDERKNFKVEKVIIKISKTVLSGQNGNIISIEDLTDEISKLLAVSEDKVIIYGG